MAHFSPVNGAFPHKDQIDRTCLVAVDQNQVNEKIERGTIIVVNKDGEFEVAKDATVGPLYFALQGYDNLQAAMAGTVGFAEGKRPEGYRLGKPPTPGRPAITGLSFQEHGNYETDVFKEDATYNIGDKLTVENGKFKPLGNSGGPVVATVYDVPKERYVNDAVLVPGWSTGNRVKVLRVSL